MGNCLVLFGKNSGSKKKNGGQKTTASSALTFYGASTKKGKDGKGKMNSSFSNKPQTLLKGSKPYKSKINYDMCV